MSYDRVATAMAQVALSADGAFFGVGVAYVAFRCFQKYTEMSSALRRIRLAPELHPSDLRAVLSGCDDREDGNGFFVGAEKLVIVRGIVEAKSTVDKGNRRDSRGSNSSLVFSPRSGEMGVILKQSQSYVYNEWRFFGWSSDLWSLVLGSWRDKQTLLMKKVPFALLEPGSSSRSEFVIVNLEGSAHPLPLETVHQDVQGLPVTPYSLLCALSGLKYPVGTLYEEKMLPVGKQITAVGICRLKDGNPEILSCSDLPYFLSNMTQNQMVSDISCKMKVLIWSGLIIGTFAGAILGYSVVRNWRRWKDWRLRRLSQRSSTSSEPPAAVEALADEESGDVPDGELCAVCVMRRRRSAFTPCGHLVCCQRCALRIEREASPLCPVCRQPVRGSVRIYVS